jgi:hypothetical protein
MTICEKTNVTVAEVLGGMVIKPKYVELIKNNTRKVYNIENTENLNHYKAYFIRNNAPIVTMNYNNATKILKIFAK